jgi:uncharacterized LabA/DUF88 family protein
MSSLNTEKLAILIDADNAQASVIGDLLREVARYGTATVKRAYGDWTTPYLNSWRETLNSLAIQPIQQFRYTTGKNATDSALIIEAMDLLHGGKVDGFCLVSSDSDFTRLATRIREAGLAVYGFGEKKTPRSFVAACDKFIYTEILRVPVAESREIDPPQEPLKPLLIDAVAGAAREDGWAPLSNVGSLVAKSNPSFDPRNYGFEKLGELVRRQSYLKVKSVPASNGSPNGHLYVRLKAT